MTGVGTSDEEDRQCFTNQYGPAIFKPCSDECKALAEQDPPDSMCDSGRSAAPMYLEDNTTFCYSKDFFTVRIIRLREYQ